MIEKTSKAQRIAYPNNPAMAAAFVGMVRFAMHEPEIIDHFHHATGLVPFWTKQGSAIDIMIDQATGYQEDIVNSFIDWLIENYWGEDPFKTERADG